MDSYGGKLRDSGRKAMDFKNAPSMTKQSFRDGTRVDRILKQYATKGVDTNNVGLFQQGMASSHFGVADMVRDYQAKLNEVIRVKAYFAQLPSRIRDFFRHDPANMLDYMVDPGNREKCVEMGLFASPPKAAAPANVSGGAPAPSPSKPGVP